LLQNLLNKENVAKNLGLLVEGLDVGSEATIEEYVEHKQEIQGIMGGKSNSWYVIRTKTI
jgi:hypothetical protein